VDYVETILTPVPVVTRVTPLDVDSARRDAKLPDLYRAADVPQAFRFAARLLVRNGHYQGDYMPDPFDRRLTSLHVNRPLSIVAALRCVANGSPHVSSPLSEGAVKVLAHRLLVDGEPPFSEEPFLLECHVAEWGDVEGRTVESCVAVLEAAADSSEVSA
jgi:hypothetical protein